MAGDVSAISVAFLVAASTAQFLPLNLPTSWAQRVDNDMNLVIQAASSPVGIAGAILHEIDIRV